MPPDIADADAAVSRESQKPEIIKATFLDILEIELKVNIVNNVMAAICAAELYNALKQIAPSDKGVRSSAVSKASR